MFSSIDVADMDLKESLREIAELLLLIHESYVQDIRDKDEVLFNLLGILQGLQLLGNTISVCDAEICYRHYASDGMMEYSHFYAWLRCVAKLAYPAVLNTGGVNAALQKLLSERVIPLASAGFPDVISLSSAVVMPVPVFDLMIAYQDFFKLLFLVSGGRTVSARFVSIMCLGYGLLIILFFTYLTLVCFVNV